MMANAQNYSSSNIGQVMSLDSVTINISADSAGSIILSTPTHSIYLDRGFATTFVNTLDAIITGMKDLEANNIDVTDTRMIGKLAFDGTHTITSDGIVFRFELNTFKDNKILLLMYSTLDSKEDILLTSTTASQLSDTMKKAMASANDYRKQYAEIQAVIDKIDSTAFK
jgi:hypothetical protein